VVEIYSRASTPSQRPNGMGIVLAMGQTHSLMQPSVTGLTGPTRRLRRKARAGHLHDGACPFGQGLRSHQLRTILPGVRVGGK